MTRIFIDTDDAENYEDIESELEAYNVDFDYDNGGRMMVDDSDADIVMDIIEDFGVKAAIVRKEQAWKNTNGFLLLHVVVR